MIKETIYVAVNQNDDIQWVQGSSKKTRYFRTDRYLKREVEYHNKYHPDDIWEVRKCVILEDELRIPKWEQVDKNINVRSKDESQKCSVNSRPYTECSACEHFRCMVDEPQYRSE